MFKYTNPIYAPFHYTSPNHRREVTSILSELVSKYNGVMPNVEPKRQVELNWVGKFEKETPRLSVSWEVKRMEESTYKRLVEIFADSVVDDETVISRERYRRKGAVPARFVGFDAQSTGRIRGFPIYSFDTNAIHRHKGGFTREKDILWVARKYGTVSEARENMRTRGENYWFYSDGRFVVDLRLSGCKEIEFIDSALRISIALNGSHDSFDRYEALSLAQKKLARRNKETVSQGEIVGLEDVIEDIKFRQFFSTIKPEEAKKLGVSDESVLLVGVPGTGKSSIASSLLGDPNLEEVVFIPLNIGELLEASYSSDKLLGNFFEGVRDLNRRYDFKPMLWCDDLEAAFLRDTHIGSREIAVSQSTLLNNLQGVTKNSGIRISGSTNYPEKIDPRFLEFGRISYMFHIPIPRDPTVLARILETHILKRDQVLAEDISLDEIASSSIGFTPRMLVNLVNEAGIQAARRIYGSFPHEEQSTQEPVIVKLEDYEKAGKFLRKRSDLNFLVRRDEEIATFVEKQNRRRAGF